MIRKLLLTLAGWLAVASLALAQININTASPEQLDGLKGIGPAKARAIVDYRQQHGPFKTVDDLQNVPGIGPSILKGIRKDVTIGGATRPLAAPPPPKALAKPAATPAPTTPPATPVARPAAPAKPAMPRVAETKAAPPAAPTPVAAPTPAKIPAVPPAQPARPAVPGASVHPATPATAVAPAPAGQPAMPARPAQPARPPAY